MSKRKSKTKKKKIMIIDDNRELLEELSEMLIGSGYEVTAFSAGRAALKRINKIKPDLLLLDLWMDRMSGFEIAYVLTSSPEFIDVPIISMSGLYAEKEDAVLMRIAGISKCLMKPFEPDLLIKEIEESLGESSKAYAAKGLLFTSPTEKPEGSNPGGA